MVDLATLIAIQTAIAALPDNCLLPWVKLDNSPYLHATDNPKASPWATPVVGRFDYLATADYIAMLHPVAMTQILNLARIGLQHQDDWK